ncbi:hypothetical protein pEaSNUABM14_00089 [Erwinia phage pEa_SNUABM_14]|uniref:Uncharacterized protein n=1 Tax=Erwinia phage pEa_SNUABM_7 TaxID=2866695 RepID=A0AAE7WS64_9CAUD|nr:hypothetical protein MPK74_gp090 [Erwinia phage pEa_SNUABM_7]QYW04414.1 hypothetical protein pEaSNUABM14_00089 [Erwinia phage pEa_SNUABM_14]QYW04758.1 hypothetical protein pEaSNUABM7_00090 [Erwinia phage pEa_SNUABM_7]
MYISKAMMNMRGDALSSNNSSSPVDAPWVPALVTPYNAVAVQGGGAPYSTEVGAAILFSTGDTIPDSIWNTLYASNITINALSTALNAAGVNCTMSAVVNSSSNAVRIINQGDGTRMLDILIQNLGRITYTQPFNRMYLFLSGVAAIGTTTAIPSVVELTPADLTQMGATLTDNGDGTYTLSGPIVLNNITFS